MGTVTAKVTDASGNIATTSLNYTIVADSVNESIPTQAPAGYAVPSSASQIQAACDAGPTYLPAGDWLLTTQLRAGPVFDLMLHPQAVLWKTWDASNATTTAMFRNKVYNMAVPNQSFKVQGGTIKVKPGMGGGIFAPYSSNIVVRYVDVQGWSGGGLWKGGGEGAFFDHFTWECLPYDYSLGVSQPAGSGCAGFRWFTGSGKSVFSGGRSGDDALQFVPSGATSDPFFNAPDIHDFWYEDCVGDSNTARCIVSGLQAGTDPDGDTSAGMRQSVRNSGWRRCTGSAGGIAVNVANHNGIGVIDGLLAEDCHFVQDGKLGTRGQPAEVWVQTFAGLGAVRNIDLRGVTVDTTRIPPKDYADTSGPVGPNVLLPTRVA